MPVWASDYEHLLHEGLDDGMDGSMGEGDYEGYEDEVVQVDGDLELDEDEVDGEVDLNEDDYFDLTY
jgi:predicted NUDIX family phosphoesterase